MSHLALLYRRHTLAPIGIGLLAYGLAERLVFFSPTSAAAVLAGVLTLALASIAPDPPGGDHIGYPVLLVGLAVLTVAAPLVPGAPDPLVTSLTVGAAVAFYVCGLFSGFRRYRLLICAAMLIAAHAVIILKVPVPPHQDVWRELNYGADALMRGHNFYGGVVAPDGATVRIGYPPGVVLLLAPFRLVEGDIRWAYILCEAVVVVLLPRLIRRATAGVGGLVRWQEALVLLPLVLPRASQAFFVFSNHEWLLLALALGGLLLAMGRRVLLAGLLLGLGIASKQYFIVFPVLFLLPTLRRRAVLIAIAVAVVVTLPFIAWGPGAFWSDVFGNLANAPDPDRITVWAMLVHAGLPQSRALAAALALGGVLATLTLAWVGRRDLRTQLFACGLGLFAFTLGATFAGYNYYVYGLVLVTWALMLPRETAGEDHPAEIVTAAG